MANTEKITILLTACTHPDIPTNTPTDVRELQIEKSISFYSYLAFVKSVVVIDNSDFDIEKFNNLNKVTAKHISTIDKNLKSFYDKKTAGEIELIRTAVNLIPENDFVVKVTGRLQVPDLEDIVEKFDYSKFNVAQYYPKEEWLSTWFFAAPNYILKKLFDDNLKISLYSTLEKILFKKIPVENINALKGDWEVIGNPDSICMFHTPNYRFDGVTKLSEPEPLIDRVNRMLGIKFKQ